jgi:hypothetical protein
MSTQDSLSFYQVIQQKVDGYLQHINLTSREVIQYVTIFGLGFLVGMLCKRYGTIIISSLIGIILVFSVLSYLDFISVQTMNIKIFLHLEHVHGLDDLIIEIKNQATMHMVESILAIIAIIIGFKLG